MIGLLLLAVLLGGFGEEVWEPFAFLAIIGIFGLFGITFSFILSSLSYLGFATSKNLYYSRLQRDIKRSDEYSQFIANRSM